MTKQITPEEDRRETKKIQFKRLQERIVELNGYETQPRVDIELITTEQAVGRVYLDTMFDKLEQRNLYGSFEHTLLENRLFHQIADRIASLRKNKRAPTAFSIDAIQTIERTNYTREYAYSINFYGNIAR